MVEVLFSNWVKVRFSVGFWASTFGRFVPELDKNPKQGIPCEFYSWHTWIPDCKYLKMIWSNNLPSKYVCLKSPKMNKQDAGLGHIKKTGSDVETIHMTHHFQFECSF